MGHLSAMGMAGAVSDGMTDLDTALGWHLSSNHYPPIPMFMLPVAKRAIKLANKAIRDGTDEDPETWDKRLRLPKGVQHRTGGHYATLGQIIEYMHLDAFINMERDEYEPGEPLDDEIEDEDESEA